MEHQTGKRDNLQRHSVLSYQSNQSEASLNRCTASESNKISCSNEPATFQELEKENTGRWTHEEHELFLKGLKIHGKGWKKVAEMIKTRTIVQIRTHAQKYFQKIEKAKKQGLPLEDVTMDTRSCALVASLKKKKVPKKKVPSQASIEEHSAILTSENEESQQNLLCLRQAANNNDDDYAPLALQSLPNSTPSNLHITLPTEDKVFQTLANPYFVLPHINTSAIGSSFQPKPKFSTKVARSIAPMQLKPLSSSLMLNSVKSSSGVGGNSPTSVTDKNLLSFDTLLEKQQTNQNTEIHHSDWRFEPLPFDFFPTTLDSLNPSDISLNHSIELNQRDSIKNETLELSVPKLSTITENSKLMQTSNLNSTSHLDFVSDMFELNLNDQFFSIDHTLNHQLLDISLSSEPTSKKQKMCFEFQEHDDIFHLDDFDDFLFSI